MIKKTASMNHQLSFDAVVVGAGLAGCATAITMAKEGLKVAIVERGQRPGSKNYFGGALYTHAIAEILPDYMEWKPPFERAVTEAGFWFLSQNGLTKMTVQGGYLDKAPADAFITLRSKFDVWWADQAQRLGAFLIPKTTVVDLLRGNDGRVQGIKTDREDGVIHSPIVIICEGVNNLLTQRVGLISHDLEPSRVALGIKQLISLPADIINSRFGLQSEAHGLAVSVLGDVSLGLPGMGFVYTGKNNVSIGLGVNLDVLAEYRLKPYEVLKHYLEHPIIKPLIKDGQLLEYGAHLIPEGGWIDLPALQTDGVMVAGDAAAMVNALHWEGTNMAMVAGRIAGETAVLAHTKNDFTSNTLSEYSRRLEDEFLLKDLRQYRGFSKFLETHPQFMDVYPSFMNDAMGLWFSAFGKPKKQLFREIFQSLTKRRSMFHAAADMISMAKAVMGW